jgi:hypothetical protein
MQTRYTSFQIPTANQLRALALVLCSAALLSACGGGGGGATPAPGGNPVVDPPVVVPPVGTDYPVANVMSAFVQTAHTYDLTGTLSGQTYTLTDAYVPQANSTFEGKPTLAALQTTTIKRAGVVFSLIKSNLYFTANPYVQLGSTDPDGTAYSVIQQTSNLPTTAKIGQSGSIGTATNYTNSNKTTVADTATITWTLEADTGGNALLCIVTQVAGTNPITGYECLRIDIAGKVLGRVIKATSGTATTIFS